MTEVYAGQILGGKYRVDRVLGAGGMGMVVAATHLQLDERIAIKFLLPEALRNPEAVARFGREAKAAVKIRGEHVARVIDVGSFENGAPYMVMEYLEGRDLSALIRERGSVDPAYAVDAVLQACEALAEAHVLGIVHRDLKPANLFMTRRPDGTPCVKVLDFGISKLTNPGMDAGMTKTTAIMGSPLYMSPEQMTASRQVDARSDIWAIGVVLYELLTGRVPFSAETLPEICGLILTMPPAAIRDFSPSVPEGLQAVVLRCLEKDRERRFSNVSHLAQALAPYGSRATSRSVERIARIMGSPNAADLAPESVAGAATGFGQSTHATWGQTGTSSSSAAPLAAAAGFALLLAMAVGGFFFWRSRASVSDADAARSGQPIVADAVPSAAPPASVVVEPMPLPSAEPPAAPSKSTKPAAKPAASPAAKPPVVAKPATSPAATPAKPKRSVEDLLGGRN
jgi:serine/threonine-protein kinase